MRVNSKLPKISKSFRAGLSVLLLSMLVILAGAFAEPARSQESPTQTDSVADAARNARQRKANSARHPKIITNADLDVHHPILNVLALHVPSSLSDAAEAPALRTAGRCDSPEAQRLTRELQAAKQELAHLRGELSYQLPVISNHDLDLKYFRPGNAGLNVGSPPLLDSQPPAPARIAQVEIEDRIASLQKALRIVCEPPEAARIHIQIDDLEQQLNLLRRQFALDEDSYYSKTNFKEDTPGRARLAAEQLQIHDLQVQIEQLNQELAALKTPHP